MKTQESRVNTVYSLTAVLAAGLLAVTTAVGPATAGSWTPKGRRWQLTPSQLAARQAHCAEQHEAADDYWLALANANMLPDDDERSEARMEAGEEYWEALAEARERYEARMELSEALDEYRYYPEIDPENFLSPGEIAANPNPYWPLVPGTTYTYEGDTEDGTEVIVVEVTDETREILGVECVVVRDRVYLDGELVEDTRDWYTQDTDSNVWYFGENSLEYEDGEVVGLEGSWEAGQDSALPGILMEAAPAVGDIYRQEFFLGDAEDAAEVLALSESVTVPYGSFDNCLQTGEFTPVEPDAYEHKFYAPGIGLVLEVDPESGERVELVSITTP